MPILIKTTTDPRLICCVSWGALTADLVTAELEAFYERHPERRGSDRISIVLPEARLHDFDLNSLRKMRDRIQEIESAHDPVKPFRSAQVWSEPSHAGVLALYRALWHEQHESAIQFELFRNCHEALHWLGRNPDFELPRLDPELMAVPL